MRTLKHGNSVFVCDYCNKPIIQRSDKVTVKSFITEGDDKYYTKEIQLKTIHLHKKCYYAMWNTYV